MHSSCMMVTIDYDEDQDDDEVEHDDIDDNFDEDKLPFTKFPPAFEA